MTSSLIPVADAEFLEEKQFNYEISQENGAVLIIIKAYQMPPPYVPGEVDLLLILPAGYPNAKPDMFWTSPDVKLPSGDWPKSSDVHENKRGREWQRWSRHFPDNLWRPGVDSLRTYLAAVKAELQKGI